jgi:hypothetical protein
MKDAYLHPVSRRQALKGIAAAGTAAWATPVIATIRTRPRDGSPLCLDCSPACGGNNPSCEGPPPNDPCFCAQRHEGGCVCIQGDFQEPCIPCLSDADCGPDSHCVDFAFPCSCVEDWYPHPSPFCWGRCPFS